MVNDEHRNILEQGVEAWNLWREKSFLAQLDRLNQAHIIEVTREGWNLSEVDLDMFRDLVNATLERADLSGTNLSGANLGGADFSGVNLSGADLSGANLSRADLSRADLSGVNLSRADLIRANLSGANLRGANLSRADLIRANLSGVNLSGAKLSGANLDRADLSGANLRGAKLSRASLLRTHFAGATLTDCSIYGISAWDLNLEGADQRNLIITPLDGPTITVDNLEVAQFIYLLLHNEKIRHIIDTITSKVVLILGRFTPERKAILEAMREELRRRDYLPVLFDFEKPSSRDLTETISTLAHMARFVIADITEAKSIPQELQRIVPDLPSVPVMPIISNLDYEYAMFEHFRRYPWVLEVYRYESLEGLLASISEKVITPAEVRAKELTQR